MVQDVVNLADKANTVMSVSGDMVYFTDSRQRLAKSDNDKILQLKSGIPSWQTIASSGKLELLDTESLDSDGSDVTIASLDSTASNYSYWIVKGSFCSVDGSESLRFRINDSSASNYQTNSVINNNGSLSATSEDAQSSALVCSSNCMTSNETIQFVQVIQLAIQNASNTYRLTWDFSEIWDNGGLTPDLSENTCGFFNQNSQTQLSKVNYFLSGGSDLKAKSAIEVYGVNR